MNILAIGNSFSEDAARYLHQIAEADKYDLTVVNLYIGGCPLSLHYKNMLADRKAYALQYNGDVTGFYVPLKDALISHDWDYITLQQLSSISGDYDTYQPYLNELSAYIKKYAPKAKQVIHETWAYEQGSSRLCDELGYKDQIDMYKDIKAAYAEAAKAIGTDLIIPSGTLFQKLISAGIERVHRDTFHASMGLGRYALGLLWYAYFSGNDITENSFCNFDEKITQEQINTVKQCVRSLVHS